MDRRGRNQQGRNPWQKVQHVWLYTDLLHASKGERLSSVFSLDGTLISASAAPHCGRTEWEHGELSGEFMEWNTGERAIRERNRYKNRGKGVGKLGWFMPRTQILTSPPCEGEPAGTMTMGIITMTMLARDHYYLSSSNVHNDVWWAM